MSLHPRKGAGGPTTALPMAPCLALLKAFDPDNPTPQQAIAAAAQEVSDILGETAMADLNDGQFAALVDMMIVMGPSVFVLDPICDWVCDGNLSLPVGEFQQFGDRGLARRKVWNIGNSA